MVALFDLPTELLQLIVGKCPATDILVLSRTCRRLRYACDNAAIYQLSFEHHLPELDSTAFENKSALVHFMKPYIEGHEKPCQRNEGPRLTWLCLAVAVARLPNVVLELERLSSSVQAHAKLESQFLGKDTREAFQGVLGFLSTLPIWGYTAACSIRVASILDSLCCIFFSQIPVLRHLRIDQSIGIEHSLQLAFCLAISSLQRSEWQPSRADGRNVGDPRIAVGPGTNALHLTIRTAFEGPTRGPENREFHHSWIGRQTNALLLAVLISRNIHYVAENGQPSIFANFLGLERRTRPALQIQLPNPSKIEFISPWYFTGNRETDANHELWTRSGSLRARFPLLTPNLIRFRAANGNKGRYFFPFAGDEWWSWYTTRVRDMARRLAEGEWHGAYTHGLSLGGRVDAPMERIFFRQSGFKEDTYEVEAVNCKDGMGHFTLRGQVNTSNSACTVRLRKQYRQVMYILDGLITPLGICGCYYLPPHRLLKPMGYFWLWKREWMDNVV
ncbi:hypothetical protein F4779DRAFT_612140 [Xylariaceae sp. FL0662B]|nr:hypothetical protein F4779DRAFT_612140 [Xylariaceae sp. FL0662B]